MAHLAPDGGQDALVAETSLNLDDDRADLKPPGGGVMVRLHMGDLGVNVDVVTVGTSPLRPPRPRAPVDRRSILQDASRGVVLVGEADPAAAIGDPQTRLRDGGVGTVVSGERHFYWYEFFWCFR